MSDNPTWNDTSREELRESLRRMILGEIRLMKSGGDDVLDTCQTYIGDECPEDERAAFVSFAADQLEQAAARYIAEQAAWPADTDCDRLDRVEVDLRDRGILLWQVSPCCDTCTGGELPDRIDEIDRRHPGFRECVRGYAFFIDQNMAEMLAESTELSVYLAYGWFSPESSDVAPDIYKRNALSVAQEICDCLHDHGFKPIWDGDFSKKIGVSLNWQRRAKLM